MIWESLSEAEALARARTLPFAWVMQYSAVYLGPAEAFWAGDDSRQEWLEARFFGPAGELRFTRETDDTLAAWWLQEEPGEDLLDETRPLRPGFGTTLTVRRLLCYDDDGQVQVAATRLLDWKGGERL